MALKICVKSTDEYQKQARRASAERVVAEFGNAVPDKRLLCFFDDEDWQGFKNLAGNANRGFCTVINGSHTWSLHGMPALRPTNERKDHDGLLVDERRRRTARGQIQPTPVVTDWAEPGTMVR